MGGATGPQRDIGPADENMSQDIGSANGGEYEEDDEVYGVYIKAFC